MSTPLTPRAEGTRAGAVDAPEALGGRGTDAGERVGRDPDGRWLRTVMDAAFFLLLGSSLIRFLSHDRGDARTGWTVTLFAAFGLLYVLGRLLAPAPRAGARPTARHLAWLGGASAVWIVLLTLAPSATWCAMPLLFAGLHALPARIAVPVAAVLTALVVASQIRVSAGGINPNMVVAPPALAAVATAVLVHLQRQTTRQRALITDLVRTRQDLAVTGRRAGVLAERQRLSSEIHDTLAQSLSSQQMLLQAAERVWRLDPGAALEHVRNAAGVASRSLVEARRFVQDLGPADLVEGTLPEALEGLAARESRTGTGLMVAFRLDGAPDPALPDRVEAALLRIAQGALANVREHAFATRVVMTLTVLDDEVSLDIADNGRGFVPAPGNASDRREPSDRDRPEPSDHPDQPDRPEPSDHQSGFSGFSEHSGHSESPPEPGGGRERRGHGLPAMRIRARQMGGALTVESARGEGTVVSVAVPLPLPLSKPDPLSKETAL